MMEGSYRKTEETRLEEIQGTGSSVEETRIIQDRVQSVSETTLEISKEHQSLADTTKFKDGKRQVDYVLSYKSSSDDKGKVKNRQKFEDTLIKAGLELELEPKEESSDGDSCFVKVHAPWPVLAKYAEAMHVKMPLKDHAITTQEEEFEGYDLCSRECTACFDTLACFGGPCRIDNEYQEKYVGHMPDKVQEDDTSCGNSNACCFCCPYREKEQKVYNAEFSVEKMEYFDIKDEETFFSKTERSRITHRVLSEARFGKNKMDFGVERLIGEGVYDAAFPIHEGNYEVKKSGDDDGSDGENTRCWLYKNWGRFGKWYKYQPLNTIRNYFGEKVAMYFGFLGFYTTMLVLPALVGVGVVAYGIINIFSDSSARAQVCGATNTKMCPLCYKNCKFWNLSDSCIGTTVTAVFDNDSTIFFAIFMSVWVTLFLECWKRKQFKLSYEWGAVDYDEARDVIRPEYEVLVKTMRLNPVTMQMEPFLERREKYKRVAFSIATVLFWILLIISAVVSVIAYRISIHVAFDKIDFSSLENNVVDVNPELLTSLTSSIISLVIIMILNKVYGYVAIWLTKLELPRTQNEYEDNYCYKMFSFLCINFFANPFYVAFVKVAMRQSPDKYYRIGQWEMEQCEVGGCMYELSFQLMVYMIGGMLWGNFCEFVVPWAKNKYRQYKSTSNSDEEPGNLYTRWEQDYDLQQFEDMGLFDEYLEMIVQFSFVTLFVCAFPLAPFFALLNNLLEIRLDAKKFACERRKPLPQKCTDIGAWFPILEFISGLAAITNAVTIAFTSDAIPRYIYYFFYSENQEGVQTPTMAGYIENSLSLFNMSDLAAEHHPNGNLNNTDGVICRYTGYRNAWNETNKYQYSTQYWHILVGRLAFVIVMEHVVFLLKRFFNYVIPDKSPSLQHQIKREHYLVKGMFAHADQLKNEEEEGCSLNDGGYINPSYD